VPLNHLITLCFLARHSPRPPAPDRPPAQHIHRRQHQHQAAFRAAQRHHRPAPHVDLVHSPKQARGFLVLGQLAPPTRTTRPSPVSRGATRTTRLRVAEKAQRNRVVEKCMASKAHEVRVAEQWLGPHRDHADGLEGAVQRVEAIFLATQPTGNIIIGDGVKGREISRGLSCLCSVAGAPVTQQIEMEIAKDYRPSDAKNHDGGEHGGDDERGDDRLRGA